MSSGRRLIITNVADDVSFSARRLSFNAKELRFLSEELAKWLSEMYGEDVDPDLPNSLISGVVLLTIVEKYLPNLKTVGKWHRNAAPMSFQARDNIRAFANACVELGMRRADVCNYSNFEKGDLKQITATLCAFAKLGIPKGLNKVSENLEQYVENAYNEKFIGMDAVEEEEEIKLTEEEVAELERKRQEEEKKRQEEEKKRQEEEEQKRQEEERKKQEEEERKKEEERILAIEASLAIDVEEGKKEFDEHYHNAVNVLCSDLVDIEMISVTSSESEEETTEHKPKEPKSRTAVEIQEQISSANAELERALNVLDKLRAKRETALKEGANVNEVDKTIAELLAKISELETMISQEEEVHARVAEEERLRKEEEERLRREAEEEAERKRLEEEEAERKRLEEEEAERKRQEEIEKKRIMEAERLRQEAEAEKKRQEEEAEKKRQEEEAEKKRQEEAEKKRQEEAEAERVRLELEQRQREEDERIRREEEEAAKKCKGCRNRRSKDDSLDEDSE